MAGEIRRGGRPSPRISTHGTEARDDRRAKAAHSRGEDSSPQFCTAFCDVGRVHRRPDRRWTPREAGPLPPFTNPARRDSPIPECKASKTKEETLLRRFRPSFEWLKSSIAVPTGDGHPGRRVATSPHRSTARRDPRIPARKASKTTQETFLGGFEPFLRSPRPSIAVSPGGGCGERGALRAHFDSRRGGRRRSTPKRGTQWRGRLFPTVLHRFLGR